MELRLHGEQDGDASAIEEVNCRAFGSMGEAHIVRLMRRYYPCYDPRYSVVAWDGTAAIGHTLGTPLTMRLMGKNTRAVAIGPVAVIPEYQQCGVGGQLLTFVHELARQEGFALAFLYGHPTYYPRYGYQACFGGAHVSIDRDVLPQPTMTFRQMPVHNADIPWLVERHAAELADVDFAWPWGATISEWTIPPMNCLMWWTADGRRAAYTMTREGRQSCKLLLADDPMLAREVLASIRPATLEHHPAGWLARQVLDSAWGVAQAEAWSAAMAFELQPGVLQPYLDARATGERLPGMTMFPLPFQAC
jgi:predicted N-acetyltransferase YhbS